MRYRKIPDETIRRLPAYLRGALHLSRTGATSAYSKDLADLVGVGNVGSALLAFPGFRMYGFEIAAAFNIDRRKIGRRKAGVRIEDVATLEHLHTRGVRLGIIAVPEAASPDVADTLVETGIKGILNFSPRRVGVPRGVKVITTVIAMDLARLPYDLPGSRT